MANHGTRVTARYIVLSEVLVAAAVTGARVSCVGGDTVATRHVRHGVVAYRVLSEGLTYLVTGAHVSTVSGCTVATRHARHLAVASDRVLSIAL
ncbi:MAG TPA: hypothetical protein PLC15_16055, partial [Candidatus Obscuribacter sp.]|nr:hypothetical protein [Candidatus Obscuribacter sp.]HNB16900.1 hypothetical protein [Candidatus Obscuribacter sp.]HND69594.1 hypothetical protein [Candidatus Obscuribacter sp.]HNG18147.1 hypothetical protein [Candidatus Obscuribacter sp.]HNG77201.1 hypothetical protein [Candidatus Obscuribacter sp.]